MHVDYSLYLVTDREILCGRNLFKAVEEAVEGGVTLVQLREKNISSREFYEIALKLKSVLNGYKVPLIINDRLDIALAVDSDGLHVGQSDLPIEVARKLMGPDKIIGLSVSSVEEAVVGEKLGADYLGAGAVYATGSKADAGEPIGIETLKKIKENVSIPIVGIGGIGVSNIHEIRQSGIAGISLISAILGQNDIKSAAKSLKDMWRK